MKVNNFTELLLRHDMFKMKRNQNTFLVVYGDCMLENVQYNDISSEQCNIFQYNIPLLSLLFFYVCDVHLKESDLLFIALFFSVRLHLKVQLNKMSFIF